jgi:outer membrane receptor protein involved in Fe transport
MSISTAILRSSRLIRHRGLLAAGIALISAPVTAAAPPSDSRDTAAIIVTARQHEEELNQVPISVTALQADEIRRVGAETLAEIARTVPNLVVAPVGILGSDQPAIRGIFSPTGSATVGLYLDEVPIQIRSLGFSGNADIRTFDLARVEVLRGPQGTLFGANSMGGTIRFITRQPDLDQAHADSGGEIGTIKGGGINRAIEGAVGVPLVPGRLALRSGFHYRHDAGYVDRIDRDSGAPIARDVNDVAALAVRAGLKAQLGDTIEVTPAIMYQRTRRDDYPLFESGLGPHRQSFIHDQPGKETFVLPSLTARISLPWASITSVSALFSRRDRQVTDYSTVFGELVLGGTVPGIVPEGGSRSLTAVSQRSFTQEVRLASPEGEIPLRWVVGGFFRQSRLALTQTVVEPGIAALAVDYLGVSIEEAFGAPLLPGGVSYHGVERVGESQAAVFGEVVWRINDRLDALAGLRVTRSNLNLRVTSEGPYAGGSITVPGERKQRETPVTPRLGLAYRPGADSLVYASLSKGFRIGGANPPVPSGPCAADLRAFGRAVAPVSYDSDSLWSYEAGIKTAFSQSRLSLSVAVFQIDWKGIQQPVMLPNCGFSFTDNLGAARSRGFELEAVARPTPKLQLTTGLGFVDASFRKTILGGEDASTGDRGVVAADGDRLPYVPRWTVRIAGEHDLALQDRLRGYVRGELRYVGSYRRAPSETALSFDQRVYRGEAYTTVLLRVGIERDGWQLSAFVENLFDDRSILFSNADFVPATGTPLRQRTLSPRTVGINGRIQH